MVKCEVIEEFTLKEIKRLKNIQRAKYNITNKLCIGDKFECDKDMANYLTGKNSKNKIVVKIIAVEPE